MRSEDIWWEDPELKRAGLNLEEAYLLPFPTLREAHLPISEERMVWLAPESHGQPSWLISALIILCISLQGHAGYKIHHLCVFVFVVVVVQFSVMSDSLPPQGLQHARPPCLSLSARVCSNSCPSSWWCHPTVAPTVTPFSSCLQSFPAQGSFAVSQLFSSGDQNIGASAQPQSFQWIFSTDFL